MTEKTMAPCGCGDCTLCRKVDQTPDGSSPPIKNPLDVEEPNLQLAEEVLKKSREIMKRLNALSRILIGVRKKSSRHLLTLNTT